MGREKSFRGVVGSNVVINAMPVRTGNQEYEENTHARLSHRDVYRLHTYSERRTRALRHIHAMYEIFVVCKVCRLFSPPSTTKKTIFA